jgi:hypothetical protein
MMVYGWVAQLVVVPVAVMVVAVMQCKAMGSTAAVATAVERPMMACRCCGGGSGSLSRLATLASAIPRSVAVPGITDDVR